jgi:molybdate transport system substrate-binding protein
MDAPAPGTTIRVLATLAVRTAFEAAILPGFEAATGGRAEVAWNPTGLIMQELDAGGRADLVVILAPAMEELVRTGRVEPASRREIAESRIGLAVRAGAPRPDVSTPERLGRALLAARSVAWSRTGASGIHFETVLDRLGIGDAVRARGAVIQAGFTAERLLTGEADLAVQQVSELMAVKGVEIVGRFPEEVGEVATISAAILRDAANRPAAERLLAALTTPEAGVAYRAGGLDPVPVCRRGRGGVDP